MTDSFMLNVGLLCSNYDMQQRTIFSRTCAFYLTQPLLSLKHQLRRKLSIAMKAVHNSGKIVYSSPSPLPNVFTRESCRYYQNGLLEQEIAPECVHQRISNVTDRINEYRSFRQKHCSYTGFRAYGSLRHNSVMYSP